MGSAHEENSEGKNNAVFVVISIKIQKIYNMVVLVNFFYDSTTKTQLIRTLEIEIRPVILVLKYLKLISFFFLPNNSWELYSYIRGIRNSSDNLSSSFV